MGAVRWASNAIEKSKYPLFWWFTFPAIFGIFAALSYRALIHYGIDPIPYLYLPVGNWTSFIAGIWTVLSPLLFFKIIKQKHPESRRARLIAVFTGLGYGFAATRFIVDWYAIIGSLL